MSLSPIASIDTVPLVCLQLHGHNSLSRCLDVSSFHCWLYLLANTFSEIFLRLGKGLISDKQLDVMTDGSFCWNERLFVFEQAFLLLVSLGGHLVSSSPLASAHVDSTSFACNLII